MQGPIQADSKDGGNGSTEIKLIHYPAGRAIVQW